MDIHTHTYIFYLYKYFDFTSNYYLIVKIAMCKKLYPVLIHKYYINPQSLCSSKILRIQPVTRADSDLSSYNMTE